MGGLRRGKGVDKAKKGGGRKGWTEGFDRKG